MYSQKNEHHHTNPSIELETPDSQVQEGASLSEQQENSSSFYSQKAWYAEQIENLSQPIIQDFNRCIKSFVLLNMCFLGLGLLEVVLLILFFQFLVHSSVLAFSLAVPFLTVFSYFALRMYYQTKKPEQFVELRNRFTKTCKEMLQYQEGFPDHHLSLANAACKFAASLHEKEYAFFSPPSWLEVLAPTMEKFSCWWLWKDLHLMKELFLRCSVEEHIKLVKLEPTNLEAHAALANAYVMLSSIYADPRKTESYDEDRWIPQERFSERMKTSFRSAAERAIEEFKILKDYAPDDPWVHAQLAYSYHDLQMPEEEIHEYEVILELRPDDKETLFKLGMLYFQQGQNAKGLHIYEQLRRCNFKQAESLIEFYGAYGPNDTHELEGL